MDSVRYEFDNKINRLTKSLAYLNYCEETYGYRMYLFNMMDREQLGFVFDSVPFSPDDTVLDLGCSSGSIIDRIVQKNGCAGIGVDQLSNDTACVGNNTQYLNEDIENIEKYELHPTVTLLVDSLYFVRDPEALLRYLCGIKNNKIYLFYSQYIFENCAIEKSILQRDNTYVADILKKTGANYRAVDYSMNEKIMYEKSLQVLEKYKNDFKNEGNSDLFDEKVQEQKMGKRLYDGENAARYLYIIE